MGPQCAPPALRATWRLPVLASGDLAERALRRAQTLVGARGRPEDAGCRQAGTGLPSDGHVVHAGSAAYRHSGCAVATANRMVEV